MAVPLLALAAQAGCLLLLRLSQFGQNPFPQLPLPVILMFGVLFVGPLFPLLKRLDGRLLALGVIAAGLAVVLAQLFLAARVDASERYWLAPATALAFALGLRMSPRRGDMLSAMAVYVVCTLLANYTFDSFLPLGDVFLVNVGTLFFGITFTQRDRVHRYGRRNVYLMILAAAVANVSMALALGTPLRYVAVGFLAILLSESADTEIYQRLLHRGWLARVATSNAVSAPLDTIIFTVLAFAGEAFATPLWLARVIATDIAVKYASGMLAAVTVLWRGGREPLVGLPPSGNRS